MDPNRSKLVRRSMRGSALLIWRLIDEERVLRRDLPGYVDYCERVRYRLVPGLW
jgi:protein-S-isoprenylcysteine O-methyltransferase Ste14